MGKRTPKQDFPLPPDLAQCHPALVELAELRGYGTDWKRTAKAFLDVLYESDPERMLDVAQSKSASPGDEQAESNLTTLRRDFARWLLVKQVEDPAELLVRGPRLYDEALQVLHEPAFTLALAQAGVDFRTPRFGELQETVLMRFLDQCYRPDQVDALLETLPLGARFAYVNQPNKLGMTALHFLAYVPELESRPVYTQGLASTLLAHGARLDAEVKFDFGTGPLWGNVAHLAVASGQKELTAELIALDRNLFAARANSRIERTPFELGFQLAEQQQLKAAAGRAWGLVAQPFVAMASQGTLQLAATAPHGSLLENTVLRDLKATTNLAAFAIDKPLPFGDAVAVIERLGPGTAPRARYLMH
jgi:hypothetical protein